MRALLFVLIMPVGTGVARAQSPDMVTDRPDQTESAAVVPRGLLQVETGYLFARDGDVDGYAVPGTLFRIGLGGRLELRIGHAGIVGGSGRHGAGDSELGAKINLIERADGWRPELALLGGLALPTGDHGFSSDGVDPSFLVLFAHELLPRLSLGYNVGATWESSADQPDRDAFLVYSLVLGVRLTDRLGTFLEFFGDRQTTGMFATSASVDRRTHVAAHRHRSVGRLRRQRAVGTDRRCVRQRRTQLSITAIGEAAGVEPEPRDFLS